MILDHWGKNLAVLRRNQPELARLLSRVSPPSDAKLAPARSGAPSLVKAGQRLTSGVDPEAEGRALAQAAPQGPLAALGFGLAYHLEPLADRDLVIWEPDPGLLRLALSARDLSGLLAKARITVEASGLGDLSGRNIFLHQPSVRLYPLAAEVLLRRLSQTRARPARPDRPRVLVVPPVLGGTLDIAYFCAEALAELGCEVKTLPMEQTAPLCEVARQSRLPEKRTDRVLEPMIRFLSEVTVLAAEEFQPHLVLALAQAPLDRRVVRELRGLGAVTAFWFVEDFRRMTYYREVAAVFDHFFHVQKGEFEATLDRLGANHAILPLAAHPPQHRPLELSPAERRLSGGQVGFMGAGYPNRRRFLAELAERGLPLRLWGVEWPTEGPLAACLADEQRYLPGEEVVKIYNACQIVLNLHSSHLADAPAGGTDFVNPRTLEVPACGGFMLVDPVQGLEDFLAPGREVAVFRDRDDLLEKARHYLDHPNERARLAAAGRRRVLAEHTYYHRMDQLLSLCLGPARDAVTPAAISALEPEMAAAVMLDDLAPKGAVA